MVIRPATIQDAPAIIELCESLGYTSDLDAIRQRVNRFTASNLDCLLVGTDDADHAIS